MIPALYFAISVLIGVESDGRSNVEGAHGEAGILQIKKIVVDDVNRILGRHAFDYSDRFSEQKSRDMARIYLMEYCTEEKLGREPSELDYALTWRFGPVGWQLRKRPDAARYIERFNAERVKLMRRAPAREIFCHE